MCSPSGRYHIVFNGEVYNFAELRRELGAVAFKGGSDTEVMLAAIEAWGLEQAVGRFVGMFAFALWDTQERRLHLVRDRLGIKPLYYGFARGCLLFGSELKSLLVHGGFERELDLRVLASYFRFGYVPAPHAIFRAARKLEPGTILTFEEPGSPPAQTRRYWSPVDLAASAGTFQGTRQDAASELERLLKRSIELRMIADVPLGALLSGGIDSSTVVALMQSLSSRPIKTFSIGNEARGFDESSAAAAVARHLETEHVSLTVSGSAALAVVPRLPEMFDEPFADSSQLPTFLVSQLARQQVTVALSGDGGDELFGGYNRHVFAAPLFEAARRAPLSWRKRMGGALAGAATRLDHFDRTLLDRFMRLPAQKLSKVSHLLSADSASAMYQTLCSQWPDPTLLLPGISDEATTTYAVDDHDLQAALMLADQLGYLPNDILTKVDRASMYVGLEARVPLLDHRVVEFSWRLPTSMKVHRGTGKLPLRDVLYRYVPRELVERPKMGFGVPVAEWLRGPLRDWAESLLEPERLRRDRIFDTAVVARTWSEHLTRRADHAAKLWTLLMYQAWGDWLASYPPQT
jgi:asparagine synthase (glutamine-hydrolysing)